MAAVPKPQVPLQTHIISMLNLAKLLHNKGFHITFVNTEFNHKHILEARGPNTIDGCRNNFLTPFHNLITRLNDTATFSSNPPVTCIISDFISTYPKDLYEELGINYVLFCTMGLKNATDNVKIVYRSKQPSSFEFQQLYEMDSRFERSSGKVYIGPLDLILNQIPGNDYNSIGCSLWNPETE
uniref:Uncharacterized protein n=1 Tax=Salix viminalis TaxID=40686 RepID=A0A6N2LPC5_SALVM